MSQQGLRQASVRAVTGTTGTYEGDFHALYTSMGVASGDFDGRTLAWANLEMGTTYPDVNGALQAMANIAGAYNWSSVGSLPLINNNGISLDSGDLLTTDAGDVLVTG